MEGGECMRWRIVRLPIPFIWPRRAGRWCRSGETTDDEWSSSMLLFQGEERKRQCPLWKWKGAREASLGFHVEA
jgi:hypothetical protein